MAKLTKAELIEKAALERAEADASKAAAIAADPKAVAAQQEAEAQAATAAISAMTDEEAAAKAKADQEALQAARAKLQDGVEYSTKSGNAPWC